MMDVPVANPPLALPYLVFGFGTRNVYGWVFLGLLLLLAIVILIQRCLGRKAIPVDIFYAAAHVQALVFLLYVGVFDLIGSYACLCGLPTPPVLFFGVQFLSLGVGLGLNVAAVCLVGFICKNPPRVRLIDLFGLSLLGVDLLLNFAIPLIVFHWEA